MSGRLSRSERFERIVAELRASATVRISALADAFGVSTETVRRDIDELSRRGLVDRTYGGAAARAMAREPAVNERHRLLVEERSRIGATAAALVEPGDVLMIDSGSTTTHFARRLAATGSGLTVLTNCIAVALRFQRSTQNFRSMPALSINEQSDIQPSNIAKPLTSPELFLHY